MAGWPEFPSEIAIEGGRGYTAAWESFDQHHDDLYYVLTLREADGRRVRFMACVAPPPVDADDATCERDIRQSLARVAATGRANTSYRGPLGA